MLTYEDIDRLCDGWMKKFRDEPNSVMTEKPWVLNLDALCEFMGLTVVRESGCVTTRIECGAGKKSVIISEELPCREARVELARMAAVYMMYLDGRKDDYVVTGHELYCILAQQLYLMDKILVPESEWDRIDFSDKNWICRLGSVFCLPETYAEDWARRNCRPAY